MFKAPLTEYPNATFDFQYDTDKDSGRRTTTCVISVPEGDVNLVLGMSSCSNDSRDRFVKELGRKTSLKKALRPFARKDRLSLWKSYFDRTGQTHILNAIEKKECNQ